MADCKQIHMVRTGVYFFSLLDEMREHKADMILRVLPNHIPDPDEVPLPDLQRILLVRPLAAHYKIVEQDKTIWVVDIEPVSPYRKRNP